MAQADTLSTAGKVALVGFGEAGQAMVKGWGPDRARSVWAYDIKTDHADDAVRAAKRADYAHWNVTGCNAPAQAVEGAPLVVSLVTADQALVAAQSVAPHLAPGALFVDGNSCAPGTKRQSAAAVEDAGGRYVDMAVMGPVHPRLHKVPLLLSGPHAADGAAALEALDMEPVVVDGPVGAASTTKMVRSVMLKGLEALFLECVLAGRRAGVAEAVLASLDVTYPEIDFTGKAAYMLERAATHGVRRAAEMREVAKTVADLGLPPRMARATVDWQQQIGDLAVVAGKAGFADLADALLARLPDQAETE
ncbi:MAG: NAD(P)-dependent oxidoreductase [Rhodobacterales bacterium]|nr:NAD(P)-dependent oxidoreductase [Rhodobacterales bacterium]